MNIEAWAQDREVVTLFVAGTSVLLGIYVLGLVAVCLRGRRQRLRGRHLALAAIAVLEPVYTEERAPLAPVVIMAGAARKNAPLEEDFLLAA